MSNRRQSGIASFVAALAMLVGLTGCATDDKAAPSSGEVETRGLPGVQRPGVAIAPSPGALGQRPGAAIASPPRASGQPNVQMPTFPQRFDVQGPEADSFGFAVTQPGPVAIEVQSNGAPIEVTVTAPASAPVKQRGSGQVRLVAQATPQDIQRSPFWRVEVRAWCEDDCLTRRPRSGGSIVVQQPPVDQAVVQGALQALSAQQKTPAQSDPAQAAALTAQMEQAFQQRRAQFEQQQQQRRAVLFAQVRPQVDQLRSRVAMGATIKSRGLEEVQEGKEDVATRAIPAKAQPPGQLPKFPQPFDVQGVEADSFGFAVTQPGPVQVEVQAKGAPVIVTLQDLSSPPVSQQGTGLIRLSRQMTAQDVQKSALWVVKVRLAKPGGRANGVVMVQHPPADAARVQAQVATLIGQERASRERLAAQAEAQDRAEFLEHKARFEQQHQRRQAGERAQNQRVLDQLRGKTGGAIRTRGLNPVIDRLNKDQGQPKDQVIIYGRNFGPGGEVLFQLGPNISGTGIVEAWSDTVVVVNVPDASGLLEFQGGIAIKTGPSQSNAVPFRFVPAQEVREVRSTRGDIAIAQPGSADTGPNHLADSIRHDNTTFMTLGGSKGNDIFFPTGRLHNGWTVQEIKPRADGCGTPFCTGAVVADSRIGTNIPYFNVRWWYDALANLRYRFSMRIVGPRGVPDGIVNTGPLTPVVPPGTPAPISTASTTPPSSQPPANQPPPTMTVVPIGPALLPPIQAAPGFGTSTPPPPTMTVVPIGPALFPPIQVAPGFGTSTPPPPPPPGPTTPVITSLSVAQGQPGDPVMISGSSFGTGTGEIRFVIANGRDVPAPAGAIWSDNQIFTSVPDATGLLGFNGQVYVKRATDQKTSNLAAFRFEPALEIRELRATMDRVIQEPYNKGQYSTHESRIEHNHAGTYFGAKGNDELFRTSRLRNGWVVDDAFVIPSYVFNSAGAYVWDSRKGTDSPYLNVRWWMNGLSVIGYHFGVRIIGPRGVPDGIAVP